MSWDLFIAVAELLVRNFEMDSRDRNILNFSWGPVNC